mmetsp:Transcript_65352/g.195349  ORF Transcript_65352/g.195349 Transcript_65352/m.195349 type:complete len:191 (+) Transcript_65352:209-781(+)
MRHLVKVAYFDTEQGSQPPALLGEIRGTPTIRAFVPERKSAKNAKRALEYNEAREAKSLIRFAVSNMPNYVELLTGYDELAAFQAKAAEWGLPQVLVFSKAALTSSTLKALSVEFRRRVLIGELKASKANGKAAQRFGVTAFPAVVALPKDGGEPIRFSKEPTYNRLSTFLSKVALRKPVHKKPTKKEEL